MENRRPIIYIYTDGASSGNPGPGGYGVVMKCAGLEKEMSGGFIRTTNNRMELLAVIKGLEAIKWKNAEVEIWSDSSYVVKALNEGWLRKWESKGFVKVKNHVEPVLFAPADSLSNSFIALFGRLPVSTFYEFIINRKTDVIQSPALNCGEIFFLDECVVAFFCMITLRKPATQINTVHKSVKSFHKSSCEK